MSNKSNLPVATMGIDIGKNAFHAVGLDRVGAHHLSRRLHSQGHDARLMPAKHVPLVWTI
jgi:transposase